MKISITKDIYLEATKREGKKESLSIAQVSEVGSHVLDILSELWNEDSEQVKELLEKRYENNNKDG